MSRLTTIRQAGRVKRFHTIECLREQTIADHSWNVAQILLHLDPEVSRELLRAALNHDIPEYFTGDIPAPMKWDYPLMVKEIEKAERSIELLLGTSLLLSEKEKALLNFADSMDLMLWCVDELELGNKAVFPMYCRVRDHIARKEFPTAVCHSMYMKASRYTLSGG